MPILYYNDIEAETVCEVKFSQTQSRVREEILKVIKVAKDVIQSNFMYSLIERQTGKHLV